MQRRTPARAGLGTRFVLGLALALAPAAGGAAAGAAAAQPAAQPSGPPTAAEEDGTGDWRVEDAGADLWRVSWRAPERLPVGGDRPVVTVEADAQPAPEDPDAVPGTEVGVATVADDGRTVEAVVEAAEPPAAEELDVVLSGRTLDEPQAEEAAPEAARWAVPERALLDVDPGRAGPLPTVQDDYRLAGLRLPGLPQPVEMVGHVVEPAERSPDRPLVLLLHGRHAWCWSPAADELTWDWPCAAGSRPVPSHRGYRYVQQLLASQGYVTVSVAANGVNAQDGELPDAGAAARSRLVRAHLDRWAAWVASGRRSADLDRVVLVGHSRGGEGVARAALEIPLSAAYRVAGQVLLAPTDFSRQTTPYVPTVTVLPSCDGDVSDLHGQAYTDLSRGLVRGDTALKSSVLVVGANHNFFNTEWTPGTAEAPADDDWWGDGGACGSGAPTRLQAGEQRLVGAAYVAGAARLFTGADAERDAVRPMYDGSAVRVASTGDAVVLSHALGGRDLRVPGVDARPTRPSGATSLLCRGATPFGPGAGLCGRHVRDTTATPHWPAQEPRTVRQQAWEVAWSSPGGRAGLAFTRPLDLRAAASLDLRTVVDTGRGDVRLEVEVIDGTGRVATTGVRVLPALPRGPEWYSGKLWAQTLRVDVAGLSGVDLSSVSRVALVGRSDDGRVWVLDAAARPARVPAVPLRRAPLVDLGELRVKEGGPGRRVARVPFRVTGQLPRRGAFRVFAGAGERLLDVAVPRGARRGAVSWTYAGNRRDSLHQRHELRGEALGEVVVRDPLGWLVVRDDDPAPRLRIERLRRVVEEGDRARWRLTLSAPVDYDLGVLADAVRGPRRVPALRVDDVRRSWLDRWVWFPRGTRPPLHRAEVGYFRTVPAGRTSVTLAVPVRDDARVERKEAIRLRVETFERRWRSPGVTVFVRGGR